MIAVAAVAWADEPGKPDAQANATAPTPAAKAGEEKAAVDPGKTIATVDVRPFKPPPGYRPKRINGELVYCARMVVLGSRFTKEDCRDEAALRDLEVQKASMRNELDQRNHVCSGGSACGT
jgi:hypothetical protein